VTRTLRACLVVVAFLSLIVVLLAPWLERPGGRIGRSAVAWAQAPGYEGFGASTPGGSAGSVVHVTTLADAGPGSLRAAVAEGNRTVVFDVAGTIELANPLYVNGAFITVDGFTAPAPGITLRGEALVIRGNHGAHDVIVRGLRVRDAPLDGIQVAYGAYNVLIDHVSVSGSGDGNLDITEDSHDVTVSWSILAAPASDKNMLIKYGASRLSLHHNLFAHSEQRNPVVSTDDAGTPATDTTADIRNNVIWDWGLGVGIMIFKGAQANVVANFTASPASGPSDQAQGVVVCDLNCNGDFTALSLAYVSGNLNGNPLLAVDMNAEGNVLDAFPAPAVTTQNAYTAAQAVLAQAGARPLDAVDEQILAGIALAPRPVGPNLSASFLAVDVGGSGLTITDRTTNGGTQPAGPSTTRYFLSVNQVFDGTDTPLGSRSVGPLDPDASSVGSLTVPIPVGIAAGPYFVIARADGAGSVVETNEVDNTLVRGVSLALPDVIVASLSVPATTSPGASISVSDTTRNQSTVAAAHATTTRFFLSADAVLDAGDLPLGDRLVEALAGGASSATTTALVIPAGTAGGAHYILAQADAEDVLAELSPTNNVAFGPIQIGGPDLMVQSLTAPATGKLGVAISISDTTKNVGTMSAGSTTTRYYLSVDAGWDPTDVALGARTVPALAAGGQSAGGSIAVTIPASTPSGTYFIVARADAAATAAELDEGNNTRAQLIEVAFDLSVASISVPSAGAAGATISVSDTTTNLGQGMAPASTTAFFLSPTATLGAEGVMIGSRAVPALAQGASSTATSPVTIPAGVGGAFYVIAQANAGASSSAWVGGNNAKSKAITIGPDLTVSSLTAPASARAGTTIAVSDTTRNTVAVAGPASTTKYFVSSTSALGPAAILVGSRPVPALSGGVSNSGGASVTIPAGTAPGNYFLIAKSDGDDMVVEYSETNNTKARAITVSN
jgi:subtilase family serine protease